MLCRDNGGRRRRRRRIFRGWNRVGGGGRCWRDICKWKSNLSDLNLKSRSIFFLFCFLKVGDGGEGGGISLCGLSWDNVAVSIAEEVSMSSFDGDLKIFALKTSANQLIQLRIEKLSTK